MSASPPVVQVTTDLRLKVKETLDLVPGNLGSPAEWFLTAPMAQLESDGNAYDVPYEVDVPLENVQERWPRDWLDRLGDETMQFLRR